MKKYLFKKIYLNSEQPDYPCGISMNYPFPPSPLLAQHNGNSSTAGYSQYKASSPTQSPPKGYSIFLNFLGGSGHQNFSTPTATRCTG